MAFKRIPGTRDILPEEVSRWQQIETKSRVLFSLYNYREIRPPLIEEASLFNRSLGETTDIVQKQMFLIKHAEDAYALRPEGTASVVRAYLENNLDKTAGCVKLYYLGAMFRFERPQKGRQRQFHHIGCEVIGSKPKEASLDVEVVSLADRLLTSFQVTGYTIKLNSLGCAEDRRKLKAKLEKGLSDKTKQLCEDCLARFKRNILRILDCKNETCRKVVGGILHDSDCLCDPCRQHFDAVKNGLNSLDIAYEVSPYLVRGLDYYTSTVFEISHPALGAQDALGAGGRYDTLVEDLGGPSVGAIGFAFGVERVLLALEGNSAGMEGETKKLVYVIALGEAARARSIGLLHELRGKGIAADADYEARSLKGAMRQANDAGARYVLIIGDDELAKGTAGLKDMSAGGQEEINLSDCVNIIKGKL